MEPGADERDVEGAIVVGERLRVLPLPAEGRERAVVAGVVDVRDRDVREAGGRERVAVGAAAAGDEHGHAALDHALVEQALRTRR